MRTLAPVCLRIWDPFRRKERGGLYEAEWKLRKGPPSPPSAACLMMEVGGSDEVKEPPQDKSFSGLKRKKGLYCTCEDLSLSSSPTSVLRRHKWFTRTLTCFTEMFGLASSSFLPLPLPSSLSKQSPLIPSLFSPYTPPTTTTIFLHCFVEVKPILSVVIHSHALWPSHFPPPLLFSSRPTSLPLTVRIEPVELHREIGLPTPNL